MFFTLREISIHLFQQLSVILICVFSLSKFKVFRNIMLKKKTTISQKVFLMIFFGFISILGTYMGFPVKNAIANIRAVGIIVAGLVSGPVVGLGAGMISGTHRYFLGGMTISAAFISAVLQGFLAGKYHEKILNKKRMWPDALLLGAVLEIIHMLIVIMISRPLNEAVRLVELIGPPMIIINSIGVGFFIAILENIYHEQEKIQADAAQLVLQIANKTLPILRQGLNKNSAKEAAQIIHNMCKHIHAVSLTSREKILAFVGTGEDIHSRQGANKILLESTKKVLKTEKIALLQTKKEIKCSFENCPISAKAIVPLKENNVVVGTLILYKTTENSITPFEIELAQGLAQLISTQIEISKGQHHAELLAQAEIRALQAQINPHFLFNALNTIVYQCLKKPKTASELIIHLGEFYRNNLVDLNKMVDLDTEIRHVNSYVKIEMARFGEKLEVLYKIDRGCTCLLPPLILQPIVENAIKHGILPKKDGGTVTITGKILNNKVNLIVEDDGVGMSDKLIEEILEYNSKRDNIGLYNVYSRLKNIYGDSCDFRIESWLGRGTRITISIPLNKKGADNFESINS